MSDLSDKAYLNTLADENAKGKLLAALRQQHHLMERPHLLPFRLCKLQYQYNDGIK
jgi:hypothetical protein